MQNDWNELAVSGETLRKLAELSARHRDTPQVSKNSADWETSRSRLHVLFVGEDESSKEMAAGLIARDAGFGLQCLDTLEEFYEWSAYGAISVSAVISEHSDEIIFVSRAEILLLSPEELFSTDGRQGVDYRQFLLDELNSFPGLLIYSVTVHNDATDPSPFDVIIRFNAPGNA